MVSALQPLRVFALVASMLALLPAAPAAARESADLPEAIRSIVQSTPVHAARAGVIVSDLESGEVVFARNADELLNPASNVKIVTTVAGLAVLGPHYRYPTEVLLGAPVSGGVVKGDIYLRGKGDPSLSAERLYRIARQLRHMGIQEISGNLIADDSFFDAEYEGPGWEQDDSDRPYMAGAGALSLNLNVVEIRVFPGEKAGQPARVVVEPESDYVVVQNHVATVAARSRSRIDASSTPDGRKQRIVVSGRLPVGHPGVTTYRRISHPPLFTAETFKRILAEQQIQVKGRVRQGVAPANLRPVHTDWSEPLAILVHRLNKWSQNHMSEMLLKTIGAEELGTPGTWAKGISATEAFLAREVGIPKGSLVLRNGSGLNDTNRFSARHLLRILEWAFHNSGVAPELMTSLPIAGVDGTTRNRLVGTEAQGRIRAKTGTLQNVTALSGYAFSSGGRPYAFSIVVNDYPGSLSRVLPGVDAIGAAIASADSDEGTSAALALAQPIQPDASTPTEILRTRVATFGELAQPDRNNATFLRTALRTERDPALRAVIAEALHKADPEDGSTASLVIENFSTSDEVLGRLRQLDPNVLPPVVGTLIDLAAGGSHSAIAHLMDIAEKLPVEDPMEAELAAGLAEVGRTAPEELIASMEEAGVGSQMRLIRLLAQGFAPWDEAKAISTPVSPVLRAPPGSNAVSEALAHEGADPRLTSFARLVERRQSGDGATAASEEGEGAAEGEAPAPKGGNTAEGEKDPTAFLPATLIVPTALASPANTH